MDMNRDWVQYSLIGAAVIALVLYVPWMVTDVVLAVAQ